MKSLVIGYGSIGKRHIDNLSKLSNLEIIVCTKRKPDNFLKKRKCIVSNSLDECIKQYPDFAIIANETSLHCNTAIKLAQSKIHFICEKPLSNNIKNINKLLDIVKKNKLKTLMGCNLRFYPPIKKIKQLLSNEIIGDVLSSIIENGSYLPDWHPEEDYSKSYASQKKLGGGVVLTSIHELDYLYWFFGNAEKVFSFSKKQSTLKTDVEDLSSQLIHFKNNVISEIHLDFFQKPSFRRCKIIGTDGLIYWDSNLNTVNVYSNKRKTWTKKLISKKIDYNSMYVEELQYFMHCLKTNVDTFNPVSDGAVVLKIALSIKHSSKLNKVVKIK